MRIPALIPVALTLSTSVGAVNYAIDFQQLNNPYIKDHLRLSAHPGVGDEFTVEFWMRADDSIPFCATEIDPQGCWSTGNTWFYGNFIFDGHQNFEQNPGRDSFDVVVANSGRLKVVLGSSETDGSTDVVTGGAWRHVAVVREWFGAFDHRLRIYLDGALDGEQVLAGRDTYQLIFPYWGTERADWAGAGPADFPDYFGEIDEIRYWGVARSQSEIVAAMGVELVGDEPGLVHYLRLNEGSGRVAHDMRSDNDGVIFDLQPDTWVLSTAPLAQQPGPDCGDGIQNQGESGVDCGGPCFACPPATETVCDDGVDEDLDGPTDCEDPDCAADAACAQPDGLFRIAADVRDADWNPVEGVMLGNFFNRNQICIGRDGSRTWQMGLQFPIDLPLPVTVLSARLLLSSSGDNAGTLTTRIRAVAQPEMDAFAAGPADPFTTAYPLTGSFVDWTPAALPADTTLESPDLRAVIQDALDTPGRVPGGHLGLVLTESTVDGVWRCVWDRFAGNGAEALLEIAYEAQGTPVCLDARGGARAFAIDVEPPAGCPLAPGGPAREFVFGGVSDLALDAGTVDLGPLRCVGATGSTSEEVVRSADPDPPAGAPRFYLWRLAGAADFGSGNPAGSPAPRTTTTPILCP